MTLSVNVTFGEDRRPRRPSLTPLVDVVFLLLVFFMLAARFGTEVAVPVAPATSGIAAWEGAPRLVTIAPGAVTGAVRLNGSPVTIEALPNALDPLMPSPQAPVILRPIKEARLQDVLDVASALRAAGITTLVFAQ